MLLSHVKTVIYRYNSALNESFINAVPKLLGYKHEILTAHTFYVELTTKKGFLEISIVRGE